MARHAAQPLPSLPCRALPSPPACPAALPAEVVEKVLAAESEYDHWSLFNRFIMAGQLLDAADAAGERARLPRPRLRHARFCLLKRVSLFLRDSLKSSTLCDKLRPCCPRSKPDRVYACAAAWTFD